MISYSEIYVLLSLFYSECEPTMNIKFTELNLNLKKQLINRNSITTHLYRAVYDSLIYYYIGIPALFNLEVLKV